MDATRSNFHTKTLAFIIILASLFGLHSVLALQRRTMELSMPDVRPTHDESYLCVAYRLTKIKREFIVGFHPNASATKVHHMLIYGCTNPGHHVRDTPNYVWECGEMDPKNANGGTGATPYDIAPAFEAGTSSVRLYGWALDAPALELPPGVGFEIGGRTEINYLILQIHYGETAIFREQSDVTDNSGLVLDLVSGSNTGITKYAGIYLLLSYGYVPQGLSRHSMECPLDQDIVIHPFKFRTHTHKLGYNVAGYLKSANNSDKPILIGEYDPQEPQMFYQIEDERAMTISRGDRIWAYCEYNNTGDHTVYIGATAEDEMCNYYIMYWTEDNNLLDEQECFKYNP